MPKTHVKRRLAQIWVGIALLAFAKIASADTTITVPGVDWSMGGNIWLDAGGTPEDAYFAGLIYINLIQDGQTYARDTLCVDFYTDIVIGNTYDTQVLAPGQVPGRNLDQVAWLIDNALLPGQNPQYQSALPSADWVTTVAQGEALQLAVWSITTDGSVGPLSLTDPNNNTGNQTDPQVQQWTATYLALSRGQTSSVAYVYQNWSASGPAQMLEGAEFLDNGPAPAPEPLSYVLVGTALIGLRYIGRRKRA